MKKSNVFLLGIIFLMCNFALFGQTSKVGTTGAQFLKIGVGPRAVAMGEAYTGMADDISAIYWNPAGLASLHQKEAMFQHSFWLASMKFDFASIIFPLTGKGTFGIFATFLSTPEDEVRTVTHPEGTGEMFSSTDMALGLSYARNMTEKFSIGVNVKYIRQSIWTMSANGWAVDFGSIFNTDIKHFRVGLCISNFGTPLQMKGRAANMFIDIAPDFYGHDEKVKAELSAEKWELPMRFRLGFAFDPVHNEKMRLTIAGDGLCPNDNNEYVNAGFECAIRKVVFIRGGFRGLGMEEMEGGLAAGGGFNVNLGETVKLKLDYAFVDYGKLEATHRYAISILF